jgi:hypothetical protein
VQVGKGSLHDLQKAGEAIEKGDQVVYLPGPGVYNLVNDIHYSVNEYALSCDNFGLKIIQEFNSMFITWDNVFSVLVQDNDMLVRV